MTDYPPNYKKNDELEKYINDVLGKLQVIYIEAATELDEESMQELEKRIKEYINQ